MRAKSKVQEFKFTLEKSAELMAYLQEKFPSKSRDNIKSLLKNKLVQVNGVTQTHFKFPLEKGQLLTVGKKEVKTPEIPGLKIVFEDKDIIVVNKPAGLLTISTEKIKTRTLYHTLSIHVKKENPDNKVFVVHRLDRETSGLLVFAKSEQMKLRLQKNWNDEIKQRSYIAIVEGRVKEREKTIHSYLRESKALKVHSSQNPTYGQEAITHYKLLDYRNNSSVLEVNLDTGRKNQIRVHMQEIGHPIVGDKKYGAKTVLAGRIALHALTLSFKHPRTGEILSFTSKSPL
ncbi:MAG: pseudouridine synthase [Crocinitomicaceae bacterium]|jgi:23S rRNA pseudouridine1911/1915/1917 synthase|nr:pseudouridine synthase [Crocinitomicaceae bacterium]